MKKVTKFLILTTLPFALVVYLAMATMGTAAAPDPALSDDILSMGDAGNSRVRIIDVDAQAVVNDITGPDVMSNHGTLWDGRYIWTANAGQESPGTMKVVKLDTATLGQDAAHSMYVAGAGGLCGIEFNKNIQGSNMWVLSMGAGAGTNGAFEVNPTTGFTGGYVDTGSGADNRATCGIGWDSSGTIAVASLMNAKKTTEINWPAGTLTGRAAGNLKSNEDTTNDDTPSDVHSAVIHILDTAKTAGYAYVSAGAGDGAGSAIDVVDLATMNVVGSVPLTGYNPHSVSIAHNEGFAYAHSRAVSGGQDASILVFDIGGGSGGGTKTAPVMIGSFPDGGGAGSCGVDVATKSDYCGPQTLDVSVNKTYYASADDYESGVVTVDLKVVNNSTTIITGNRNAIDTQITTYSADNGVTAASTVPVVVGDIPVGYTAVEPIKFNVPNGVSSFNVSFSIDAKDLCDTTQNTAGSKLATVPTPKDYYFTWYDNNASWGMNGDWVTINNVDATEAKAGIYVNGVLKQKYDSIPAGGGVQWQAPMTLTEGPVEVVSYNGEKLNTTQRVLYKSSFNEIRGVEKSELESEYHLTWYDYNPGAGMLGDWLLVTNAGDAAADVDITVGGNPVKTGLAIPAGEQGVWHSPTPLTDGPVHVIDNNSQPLLVSKRTIYHNSFNETPGVPNSKLTSEHWLTWYDNNASWGMKGDWVCIYNDGGSAANVEIKVNGVLKDTVALPAGGHTEWQSPTTLTDGAVQVKDTNGQPLLVSNRTIYKNSFDEVNAMHSNDAGDNADLNWYDNNASWGMNGDWVVVTNLGTLSTDIEIKVGGVTKETKTLAAGERHAWQSPTVLTGGPVKVTSNNAQPLLVGQRVLYLDSFNELLGYPSS